MHVRARAPCFWNERGGLNFGSPYRRNAKTRGRKPLLDTVDKFGLALWYIKKRSSMYKLSVVFGIAPSSVNVWVDYTLEALLLAVKKSEDLDFSVHWPRFEEIEKSAELLARNREHGHILQGIFAVADGARFPCVAYSDADLQNAVRKVSHKQTR